MSDKLPALPPRNRAFEIWWWKNAKQINSVKAAAQEAWDTQDVRIKELEGLVNKAPGLKEFDALRTSHNLKVERIAELEREIREALVLIEFYYLADAYVPAHAKNKIHKKAAWFIARKADKKQGS